MPGRDNVIPEIKSRLDVVEVAETVGLEPRGKHFNCPACQGVRKAMSKDGLGWHCVKCEEAGDVLTLIKLAEGLDDKQMIQRGAELAGVEALLVARGRGSVHLPPVRERPEPVRFRIPETIVADRYRTLTTCVDHYDQIRRDGQKYLDKLGFTGRAYELTLKHLPAARAYFKERGFPVPSSLPIKVGLAPSWDSGLAHRLYAEGGESMVRLGVDVGMLADRRGPGGGLYERMRGRVILPWCLLDGTVVYLKGRAIPALADEMKLNGSDGSIFRLLGLRTKDDDPESLPQVPTPPVPFGLPWAAELADRQENRQPVLIMEGELDVLSALISGVPALGGTRNADTIRAALGDQREPLVLYDNDGHKAERERQEGKERTTLDIVSGSARKLAKALRGRWTLCPRGPNKDLNAILQNEGADRVVEVAAWAHRNGIKPGGKMPSYILPLPPVKQPDGTTKPAASGSPTLPEQTDDDVGDDVPPGWEIRSGALYKLEYDQGAHTEVPVFTSVCHPIRVLALVQNVGDERYHVQLSGRVPGVGRKVLTTVPRSVIASPRGIVELADHGLDVDSTTAKVTVAWLRDYVRHNGGSAGRIPFSHGSSQMGWHGHPVRAPGLSFLLGREVIGESPLTYIGEDVTALKALRVRGKLERWLKILPVLEEEANWIGLCALYAALAAPVVRFIDGVQGFVFELAGASSTGKTTYLEAAMSAVGDPHSGMIRRSGNSDTINGLEMNAAIFCDLPGAYEDAHLMDLGVQAKLPMMLANGEGKGRSKRDGLGREAIRQWSSVSLITSETSLADSTTLAGTGARMLSCRPKGGMTEDTISLLKSTASRHHGHIIRPWIKYLRLQGWKEVIAAYHRWLPTVRDMAGEGNVRQRWAECWAVLIATAEVAAPIMGCDAEMHTANVLGYLHGWYEQAVQPDQALRAMEMILGWAGQRVAEVTRDDQGRTGGVQRDVWMRIYKGGNVAFSTPRLAQELAHHKINLRTVAAVWNDRGWVPIRSKVIRIGEGNGRCIVIEPAKVDPDLDFTRPAAQDAGEPSSRYPD